MEADVAVALSLPADGGHAITAETVKEKIAAAPASIDVPQLAPSVVILASPS
jgi:hypothetical protein